MMSENPFSSQPVHIAKFLMLDKNVNAMGQDLRMLLDLSSQNQKQLRELARNSESYVSHAELLAAMTGRKTKLVETVKEAPIASVPNEKILEITKAMDALSKFIFKTLLHFSPV